MLYIDYVDNSVVGVADTKDLVEECYTPAQIEQFIKKGIPIFSQDIQMHMLNLAYAYYNLIDALGTKDNAIIKSVLDYAEGREAKLSRVTLIRIEAPLKLYVSYVAGVRKAYGYSDFGYRSLHPKMLKWFKSMLDSILECYNIDWSDDNSVYTRKDGKLGNSQYDKLAKVLDKKIDVFCKEFKMQKSIVNEWVRNYMQ